MEEAEGAPAAAEVEGADLMTLDEERWEAVQHHGRIGHRIRGRNDRRSSSSSTSTTSSTVSL